jgi:hypothetical protein
VDDPLLVRVLNRRAHLGEQLQPVPRRDAALVAEPGDRHALDQLHDEERPAVLGRPGVEHPGDVRVVHHRQGLPLGPEPGQHPPRVHPRLDHLQGHPPADRLGLLGQEHDPHPPLAEHRHQLVSSGEHRPDVGG